ncbi:MAG: bifunctional phosphoglucose/phosphomannose isomerase [Chloroflexota bacterium]
MTIDLDSPMLYQQPEASGMLTHLHAFPEQCQRAWDKALRLEIPPEYSRIDKVVLLGMGGSAIGSEIVRGLALRETSVPIWVHRDYGLPSFVDEKTLVITVSYSGDTEETLSGFDSALKARAKKLALTSGGRLKRLAEDAGIPLFLIDYRAPPRASFPYLFVPLIVILQKTGLLKDKTKEFEQGLEALKKAAGGFVEATPLAANLAKQLAVKAAGRILVIYGAAEIISAIARRWKTQFNENSKTWAFAEAFPELDHNAVEGYKFPADVASKVLVFLLHSAYLPERSQLRYQATAQLLAKAGIAHELVEAVGEVPLARILRLVLLGDYLSFYLALLNGADPSSMKSIDFIKKYLT